MMKESGIEWIGEIPEKWGVVLLSSLFSHHKSKNVGLQETNLLSLSYGRIVRKDITTSEGLLPESFETYNIVDVDDIVFRLTDLQNDKRSLRTGLCKEKGIITSAYTVIRPTTSSTDSRYLQYLYHAYDICKVFYGLGDGVRQGMGFDDLKKIPTLVPALEEQKKIADFLDGKCAEIDELVQTEEKMIEELKAYKQSVITEAVTKGLDPSAPMKDSGIEWIGAIPDSWKVERMKYIADINAPCKDVKQYERISYAPMECIKRGWMECQEISPLESSSGLTTFEENDIVMAKVTPCFENGNIAVAKDLINGVALGSSELFVFRARTVLTEWLFYFLQNSKFTDLAKSTMVGTGGLKRVSPKFVSNYQMGVPSLDEQKQIADYLDEKCAKIDEIIALRTEQINQLKEYKKSLIYEYVTGKKEVV